MARVCIDLFPKGSFKYQKEDGFAMNDILKAQLDILLMNIVDDWDFTIIITGGGEVRVGKSVLAMQIAKYWTDQVNKLYNKDISFNTEDNFVFEGSKLIEKGNYLGQNKPYSALIFDEAGADLEGRKVMQKSTQEVLDYYRECGQYNLLNILVLPEFFDLPKGIAMSRSIALLDVYYVPDANGRFRRGYFNFYSRPNKKYLYLYGKRDLNYKAYRWDFRGRFDNVYPIDEIEYRGLKQAALTRRESRVINKQKVQRDALMYWLNKEFKVTQEEISLKLLELTKFSLSQRSVSEGISKFLLGK